MDGKLKELTLLADRLEAVQACRNLMGKYSYLHTAFRNREYVDLWAKREDDWIQMPFGKFVGYEGVKHCYEDIHGDRSEPDYEVYGKGMMMMHEMDTEIIEVAGDGQTAKGAWKAGTLTPLVWVPGAGTLFWETSCSSGTTAAAAWLAGEAGGPLAVPLRQPGGTLEAFVSPEGDIRLKGTVTLRKRAALILS